MTQERVLDALLAKKFPHREIEDFIRRGRRIRLPLPNNEANRRLGRAVFMCHPNKEHGIAALALEKPFHLRNGNRGPSDTLDFEAMERIEVRDYRRTDSDRLGIHAFLLCEMAPKIDLAMSQFRRRILLINRPFQIRFAIYVCSWLFVLSVIYPMLVSQLYDWFLKHLGADPNGPMISYLQKSRQDMLFWLALMQVCFMLMTFLMSLFMSHRIAGPLFKLSKTMNGLRNGSLAKVGFRQNDHFQDLAEDYNFMVESVGDQISASKTHLERALAATKDEEARKEIEGALKALSFFQP